MAKDSKAQLQAMEAREARYQDDKAIVTFEYHNEPANNQGRLGFFMIFWHANYHLGPCWFARIYLADDDSIRNHKRRWRRSRFAVREVRWIRGDSIQLGDRIWDAEAKAWVPIVKIVPPAEGHSYYLFVAPDGQSMACLGVDKRQVWRDDSPEETDREAQFDAVTDFCDGWPARVTGNPVYDEAYARWRAYAEEDLI